MVSPTLYVDIVGPDTNSFNSARGHGSPVPAQHAYIDLVMLKVVVRVLKSGGGRRQRCSNQRVHNIHPTREKEGKADKGGIIVPCGKGDELSGEIRR